MSRKLLVFGTLAIVAIPACSSANHSIQTALQEEGIPQRFQGVWDASLSSCELRASDMRGYIGPKRFRFADTIGTVQRVEKHSDDAITVVAEINSEGDLSTEELPMRLSELGNELITHGETTRYRCPEVKDR